MKQSYRKMMAAVGCAWFCLGVAVQAAEVKPAADKAAKDVKAVKSPSPAVDRAAKKLFERLKDKEAAGLTQEELKTAEPDIVKALAQLTRERVIGGTRPLAEAEEVDLADKEQVTLDDFIPFFYARAAKEDAAVREARKEAIAGKKAANAAAAARAAGAPRRDSVDRQSRGDIRRLENEVDELEYRNWQLQQQFNQAQQNQIQQQQQFQQQQQQGGAGNKPLNLGNLPTQQKPVAGSGGRPTQNKPNIDKPSSRPNKPSSRPDKPTTKPTK